eukprot:145793-Karenia_brevis.AAC.1
MQLQGLSDHAAVSLTIAPVHQTTGKQHMIPSHITKHKSFKYAALDMCTHAKLSTFHGSKHLELHKALIKEAAKRTR